MTAISLNFQEKIYPVIWSAKGLPTDSHKLIAVPAKGSLVLTLNIIAYYSQVTNLSRRQIGCIFHRAQDLLVLINVSQCTLFFQGQNLAVGVNQNAFAGEVPQRVELDPIVEVPSVTATKLAVNYVNNVHPVINSSSMCDLTPDSHCIK